MNKKELSIEEKARRYDEALAHAKLLLKIIGNATLGNLVLKNEFKNIFPELKESEDEVMRKKLLELVAKHCGKTCEMYLWIEKQGEQKPVECTNIEEEIIGYINRHYHIRNDETLENGNDPLTTYDFEEIAKHFYELGIKEQSPAWSEEDEKMFEHIIAKATLHFSSINCLDEEEINFLKSLRHQPHWKPSDGQMEILNEVLNFAANHESPHWNDYIFGTLNNLIRQLKKLREK